MDLKDIIKEYALPFLPAKSLFRFLAVCRDWKLHISTPSFNHNQSLCCRNISGLFGQISENRYGFIPIHPESCGVPDPSLRFLPEPVEIRASSNGVLCCQGRNEDRDYYLCNPVTEQWKKLPKPTAFHGSEPALVVIFEPECKLICAFESTAIDDATEFEIYSSENNSWNVSREICFGAKKADLWSGVHVNGVVYWPVGNSHILCFDLTKDRSQLLDNYSYDPDAEPECLLGTFDGRLCKVDNNGYEVFVSVLVNAHANTMPLDYDIDMWETLEVIAPNNPNMPLDDTKVVAVSRYTMVVERKENGGLLVHRFSIDSGKGCEAVATPLRHIHRPPFFFKLFSLHQLLLSFIAHQSLEILLVATMDLGKRPGNLLTASNSKLYMDLKDIIREKALPFLPAKSLFRFLAVCRDWKLHISTPSFHHNQSLCCRGISGLFCQTPENPPVFVPIHPESCGVPDPSLSFLPEPVVIRASSNGLLCCQGLDEDRYYYLCNPVTKQWKKLPKPTASHGSKPALVLIFEPSLLNSVPEYKLICAFESTDFDDATEFEIYSSKNNSWNVSKAICFRDEKADLGSGVHVNGVVYWPVESDHILSFDLTKHRSKLLDCLTAGIDCLLGAFDGRLCKVYILGDEVFVNVFKVLNMHKITWDESEMWEDTLVLDPDNTFIPLDDDYINTRAVAVSRDILVVVCDNEFYCYGFEDHKTNALNLQPEPAESESYYEICVPYVNSLVSL
nr:F-box protein At5g49610-like isoform X2 [Ipomoea batatas]